MNIKIIVHRRKTTNEDEYVEEYHQDVTENIPITVLIQQINASLEHPIQWDKSCGEKKCGACAMVINGKPSLACSTFVFDVCQDKQGKNEITLQPLSKFPVVCDLRVDRSVMYEQIKEMKLWLSKDAEAKRNPKIQEYLYESAKCMMCGCCMEACCNYTGVNGFYGAAAMNLANRLIAEESDKNRRREMKKALHQRGTGGCSKSLACKEVCPAGIDLSYHLSDWLR